MRTPPFCANAMFLPQTRDGKVAANGWNLQDGRALLILNLSLIFGDGRFAMGSGVRRVTNQYSDHEAELDNELEDEARRPRRCVSALVCLMLAATGSGAAFLWHGSDGALFAAAPKAAPAPQAAAAAQEALLKSLADAQQRAT